MSLDRLNVLILNRKFQPIQVVGSRKAFVKLYINHAHAVDENYNTYDFPKWMEHSKEHFKTEPIIPAPYIGTPRGKVLIPHTVALTRYDKLPLNDVKFSRRNILIRDNYQCQYCGQQFSKGQLNIDHVVPRAQGGTNGWVNSVCSCYPCNSNKGDKTPEQAGMRLLKQPQKLSWIAHTKEKFSTNTRKEWEVFIGELSTITEEDFADSESE